MAALTYTARKQAFVQPNRNYDYLYGKLTLVLLLSSAQL